MAWGEELAKKEETDKQLAKKEETDRQVAKKEETDRQVAEKEETKKQVADIFTDTFHNMSQHGLQINFNKQPYQVPGRNDEKQIENQ